MFSLSSFEIPLGRGVLIHELDAVSPGDGPEVRRGLRGARVGRGLCDFLDEGIEDASGRADEQLAAGLRSEAREPVCGVPPGTKAMSPGPSSSVLPPSRNS